MFSNSKESELQLLRELTANIDYSFYDIVFRTGDKQYTEKNVKSYGVRWLSQALIIHFAYHKDITIYSWDLKIISAKKIY